MPSDPLRGQRVAANWAAVVPSKPQDQIHNDYWLFNQMSEGKGFVSQNGGDYIKIPLEYALNTTVGSYSDTDTFSTTRIDVFDQAEAEWKEIIGTVVMSQIEEDRNMGQGQVFPLLQAKLESLRKSLRREINEQAFGDGTGNGGKDLTGLQNLVSATPTTGTKHGINVANFSFFRNQQISGAASLSPFDTLRAGMRRIYNLTSNGMGGEHPSFGVTDLAGFEAYESLLTANERFTDKNNGDGGWKNDKIKFKGMMLAYDASCPAGYMYFLNPSFYKWVYISGQWMKGRPEISPANQTVDIFAVRTAMNCIAIEPRRLGVITGIT